MNEPTEQKIKKKKVNWSGTVLPMVLWLVFTIGTVLLFPRISGFQYADYAVGSVSTEEIIAPFDFDILKSDDELERERSLAMNSIEPVFTKDDSVTSAQVNRLSGYLASMNEFVAGLDKGVFNLGLDAQADSVSILKWGDLGDEYSINLTLPSWIFIRNLMFSQTNNESSYPDYNLLTRVLEEVYGYGILDRNRSEIETVSGRIRLVVDGEESPVQFTSVFDISEARREILVRLNEATSEINQQEADQFIKIGYELLVSFLESNILMDVRETEARRQTAISRVALVKGIVLKDERIIDSNERFTQEHINILRSMEVHRSGIMTDQGFLRRSLPWLGQLLLVGLIYLSIGLWLARFRKDIYQDRKRFLLFLALAAIHVLYYGLLILPAQTSMYFYPAALGAIIITIIFDAGAAFIFSAGMAILIGALTGNNFFSVLTAFIPAVLSVYAVLRVRTRVQIIKSAPLILAGFLLIIVIEGLLLNQWSPESRILMFYDSLYAIVNAFATPLLALGLLILIEFVFGVTSDLTLLELADLNRPLLKRLSLEAPGTYHHSILVGNLAEAAAESIDANPLLVRAGAYYHDIGKMVRREYFVENQPDTVNIHDELEPEDSAAFLAGHVNDGLKIAREYHLPRSIRSFITEHHGTSLMVYFYNKALEQNPGGVDEKLFRYPGPKPQSKETGILMLADASEAATRSAEEPNPETIRDIVREIVINKYRDKELDECPLTLRDIRLTIEAFLPILEGIHHHRIKYPKRDELEDKINNSESV